MSGLAARVYIALLNFLSVPILLDWLGIEAMGLIGLVAAIQSIFSIVEAAVAGVVISQTAAMSGVASERASSLAVMKGAERAYWISTPIILVLTFIVASIFLNGWAAEARLPLGESMASVALLAASSALLWPASYYGSLLSGLGRQSEVALITSTVWTVRIVGGLILLFAVAKRPSIYFAWQAAISLAGVLSMRFAVRRALPGWEGSVGSMGSAARALGRSVASVSAVTAAGLVFGQMDKAIVGRFFSLETFGYYSLAWQLAGAIALIYAPVYTAFMPAISRAQAEGELPLMSRLVTDYMVVMSALVLPLGACVWFVADTVLFAWTGDAAVAHGASLFLRFAFAGAAVNALIFVPFAAQMATRTTFIMVRVIVASIAIALPVMIWASGRLGASGVVAIWAMTSIAQVGMVLYLTTRKILRVSVGGWVWRNLGAIALPAVAVMAAVGPLFPSAPTRGHSMLIVLAALLLCYMSSALFNWRTITGVLAGTLRDVREARY